MSERRQALGRGLGALIPTGPAKRPVDVFFPDRAEDPYATPGSPATASTPSSASTTTDLLSPATRKPARKSAAKAPARAAEAETAEAPAPAKRSTGQAPATQASATKAPATKAPATKSAAARSAATAATAGSAPAGAKGTTTAPTKAPGRSRRAVPSVLDGESAVATSVAHSAEPAREDRTVDSPAVDVERVIPTPAVELPSVETAAEPAEAEAVAEPEVDDDGLVPVPGATFAELPLDSILPNRVQPRTVFDEDELEELAGSIREVGVLQPVVVRPDGRDEAGNPRFELIMGERRWRASRLAGQTSVPAIIRSTAENDLLRDALLENLHRSQLNALEEAAAYQQLLEDFGCTHEELATRIARSRPQITNTLRLLKLPPLVQRRVAAGVLSAGHARALLGLADGAAMERLAQRIVAEGLSVRATEEIVSLGDEPMQPELRRRPRPQRPELDDLAARLSDRFDTKVKVAMGQRKGRMTVEFASLDDLNRILGTLVPGEPGVHEE